MTIEEAEEKAIDTLNSINRNWTEAAHIQADNALLEFIKDIGYTNIIEAYNKVYDDVGGFWYA